MPTSDSQDYELIDCLAEEFAKRFRDGERPSIQEYCDRYPHIADDLREMLPALAEVEGVRDEVHQAGRAEPPRLRQLGDFRIIREVGRGGMGVVYEAEQLSLGRRVALKVLPGISVRDPKALERFRREARAAARLHHTNIVPVFEVGQDGDTCYYAMQFIPGQGLDLVVEELRRLRAGSMPAGVPRLASDLVGDTVTLPKVSEIAQGLLTGHFVLDRTGSMEASDLPAPVPVSRSGSAVLPGPGSLSAVASARRHYFDSVAQVGQQVAGALSYAHQRGVLHRDIKPSNLLLDESGVVWVADFGLAKTEDDGLTRPGDVLGTFRYMAPERFQGESTVLSDVYALGLTLYELLTLRPAFDARDRPSIMAQVKETEPPSPRAIDQRIPRDLETIVLTAIAKNPRRRYPSADALSDDLRRFLAGEPIKARRTGQIERAWLWCRRYPAAASLTATIVVLLGTLAVGALVKNAALADALKESEDARRQVVGANDRANAELWNAYLLQARAGRTSGRPGQRFDGIEAIRKALALPVPAGRSIGELRNEAVACLSLPDVRTEGGLDCPRAEHHTLAFAPDFTRYARADERGHISIRRVDDNVELASLTAAGPVPGYRGVSFSPDGQVLCGLVAGDNWTTRIVHLWRFDGSSPREVMRLEAAVRSLSFRPDGPEIVLLTTDQTVRVYDTGTGRQLRHFPAGLAGAHNVVMHPRLPRLAVIGDGVVRFLDIESGRAVGEFPIPPGPVTWFAWHPEGHTLALTYTDLAIRLVDAETGQPRCPPLEGHARGGVAFAFSHRGDLLASTEWGGTLRLWDVPSGRLLLHSEGPVVETTIQFSPDDRLLAAAAPGDRIAIMRVAGGSELGRLPRPDRSDTGYWDGALDPEGRLLVYPRSPGLVVADLDRRENVALLPDEVSHGARLLGVAADRSLLTGSDDLGVLRWSCVLARNGRSVRYGPPDRLAAHHDFQLHPAASADGRTFLLPDFDRGARLVRVGQQPIVLGPQRDVRCAALSPDGRWAATASHVRGTIQAWDTREPARSHELLTSGGQVKFSPNGRWLLTITDDSGGEARLWHVGTWEPGPRLASRSSGAFSPDGHVLALSGGRGTVRLVVPDSGEELAVLSIPEAVRVRPQCFTPDGRRLVAVDEDSGALFVWDLARIRIQLRDLGLDWNDEPLNATERPIPEPVRVEFDPGFLIDRERYTAVLAFAPWYADGYYKRALAYLEFGQTAEAATDLDRAIAFDPKHADALYQRSRLHARADNFAAERADLDRFLDLRPDQTEVRARRGELYADAGLWPTAVADFDRASRDQPESARYWHLLAMSALGANDRPTYLRACSGIERVLPTATSPAQTNWLTWTIGLRALPDFDIAAALDIAERDFRDHPKVYAAARTVGLLRLRAGRFDDALKSLDDAAALQKDVPSVWLMRSQILARRGEVDRAREFYQRARDWMTGRPDPKQPTNNLDRAQWVERLAVTLLTADAEAALAEAKK